jgi:hypothetical protein
MESPIVNSFERVGNVDICNRVQAIREGMKPNFHKAFTQLHLDQSFALAKCLSGDRRNGGIDPHADHISWDSSSPSSCVDDDLGITRTAA